jgi:glycogen synthase
MRIAYLSGPCDAPAVYAEWCGRAAQNYFGANYMKQFFQLCEDLDACAHVITTLPGRCETISRGRFVFANHPNPSGTGLAYHLGFLSWMLRIAPGLITFRPEVMILTANCSHWFLFAWLRLFGVKIIPAFDVVLWPKYAPQKTVYRVLWRLNRWLILPAMSTMIVASDDVRRQVAEFLGVRADKVRFLLQLPIYQPSQFAALPPARSANPFRIIFAGRIEIAKGIFDLLSIAKQLETQQPGRFKFDVCGDGNEADNLRKAITDANLDDVVSYHGYCNVEKFTLILGSVSAWLVPSRSEFAAGFEMVCAEAILAGRPLICSPVCPALEYIEDAAIRVEPDDIAGYSEAIKRLADDGELYQSKLRAAGRLAARFYDHDNSFIIKMKIALSQCSEAPAPRMSTCCPGSRVRRNGRFH